MEYLFKFVEGSNVISIYRGLLIPQKDLISAPYETLTKAIFHLIESGIKI